MLAGVAMVFWKKGNNMKLRTKILGMMSFVLVLLASIAALGLYSMNNIGNALVEIAEEDIPLTNAVAEITINQLEQALWLERAIVAAELGNTAKLVEAEQKFLELAAKVDEEIKAAEVLAEHGVANANSDKARDKFDSVNEHLHVIEREHGAFLAFHAVHAPPQSTVTFFEILRFDEASVAHPFAACLVYRERERRHTKPAASPLRQLDGLVRLPDFVCERRIDVA